jgi:hypothetical protein
MFVFEALSFIHVFGPHYAEEDDEREKKQSV